MRRFLTVLTLAAVSLPVWAAQFQSVSTTPLNGRISGGGTADTFTSNDRFLDVSSAFVPGVGEVSAYEARFVVDLNRKQVRSVSLTVEAVMKPGRSATGQVFFWNFNARRWDFARAWALAAAGNTAVVAAAPRRGVDYVDAGRNVRVMVRAFDPLRPSVAPVAFRLRTDFLRLTRV